MIACKKCGFQIEEYAKFCQECGSSQHQQCDSCGTELQISAKFCIKCGMKQTTATTLLFRDDNLETAVREMLGKIEGSLNIEDLEGLNKLDANQRGIESLSGLEYAVNLEELFLCDNQISDVGPLASLTKLTHLRLSDNQISDVNPLAALTNLKMLHINDNQISDVSPLLFSLTNLTELSLTGNQNIDRKILLGAKPPNLIHLWI